MLALGLAIVFAGAAIGHNGFSPWNAVAILAYMACCLAAIYVGMWKQWDFEIVGWALFGVFFLGLAMA